MRRRPRGVACAAAGELMDAAVRRAGSKSTAGVRSRRRAVVRLTLVPPPSRRNEADVSRAGRTARRARSRAQLAGDHRARRAGARWRSRASPGASPWVSPAVTARQRAADRPARAACGSAAARGWRHALNALLLGRVRVRLVWQGRPGAARARAARAPRRRARDPGTRHPAPGLRRLSTHGPRRAAQDPRARRGVRADDRAGGPRVRHRPGADGRDRRRGVELLSARQPRWREGPVPDHRGADRGVRGGAREARRRGARPVEPAAQRVRRRGDARPLPEADEGRPVLDACSPTTSDRRTAGCAPSWTPTVRATSRRCSPTCRRCRASIRSACCRARSPTACGRRWAGCRDSRTGRSAREIQRLGDSRARRRTARLRAGGHVAPRRAERARAAGAARRRRMRGRAPSGGATPRRSWPRAAARAGAQQRQHGTKTSAALPGSRATRAATRLASEGGEAARCEIQLQRVHRERARRAVADQTLGDVAPVGGARSAESGRTTVLRRGRRSSSRRRSSRGDRSPRDAAERDEDVARSRRDRGGRLKRARPEREEQAGRCEQAAGDAQAGALVERQEESVQEAVVQQVRRDEEKVQPCPERARSVAAAGEQAEGLPARDATAVRRARTEGCRRAPRRVPRHPRRAA